MEIRKIRMGMIGGGKNRDIDMKVDSIPKLLHHQVRSLATGQ